MPAAIWLVTLAAWGVEVGWQPLSEGGVEYIIQLEPYSLQSLSEGQAFVSDVPRSLDVRTFRIVVGEAPLPREMPAAPEPTYNESESVIEGPELADQAPRIDDAGQAVDYDDASQHVLVARPPEEPSPIESPSAYEAESVAEVETTATSSTDAPLQFANLLSGQTLPAGWATGLVAVLFLSIGANLFLAWIAWSERSRFRTMLRSLRSDALHGA